jgi:hypothetical protein
MIQSPQALVSHFLLAAQDQKNIWLDLTTAVLAMPK